MPRGVEFTDQQRSVLSQLMRNAWARHKNKKPKMTKRWVNPPAKDWMVLDSFYDKKEALDLYRRANAEGSVVRIVEKRGYGIGRVYTVMYLPPKENNPGAAWHRLQYDRAIRDEAKSPNKRDKEFFKGKAVAHEESHFASNYLYMPNPRPRLSVPEQHQLKIARKTLTYSDVGARIMGGPTKDEARAIIYKLSGKWPKENPRPRRTSNPKPKLSNLLLPIAIIGAIIWFTKKS